MQRASGTVLSNMFARFFSAPFLLATWLILFGISPVLAAGFVSGIDDLPLMDGLRQTEGGTLIFDKPSGRIVIAEATGTPDNQAVIRFYRKTLPQLGWIRGKDGIFARAGERLVIEFDGRGKTRKVRFTVSPARKR